MQAPKLPNIDIDKVKAEYCKRHLWFFAMEFWDIIIADKLVWNWHMKVLCDEVQRVTEKALKGEEKENDLIINVPPGTSKTSIVSILGTAWEFACKPSVRTAVGSYSDDAIKDIADKIRVLVHCEKFKRYFPGVVIRKGQDTKHAFKTTANGAFYAFTVGGTLTSKHFDILKVDDPLNPKMAASESGLETANHFFKSTLPTRKTNKAVTPTILIMQRLNENDPTGFLLARKKEKLRHVCLPAELSDLTTPEYKEMYTNGLLDVNRLDRAVLDEMKVDLGSRGYSNQFGQSPTADGGNIIKKGWMGKISKYDFMMLRKNKPFDFFADTAYTEELDNDPTGIGSFCEINGNLYIYNVEKVRMGMPALVKYIPSFALSNSYTSESTINIEPKASGLSAVQTIKYETGLNVQAYPNANSPESERDLMKQSKQARLESKSAIIESGRVFMVEGAWNDDFEDEVCGFPNKKHDEYVDILVYAIAKKLKYKKVASNEQLRKTFF